MQIQSVLISSEIYTLTQAILIMQDTLNIPFKKVILTEKNYRFRVLEPNREIKNITDDNSIIGVKFILFI